MLTYHKTTEEEKYRITAWKYDGDYAVYNSTPYAQQKQTGFGFANPKNHFYSFYDGTDLIGFINLYEEETEVFFGIGAAPEHCGKGYGQQMTRIACSISMSSGFGLYLGKLWSSSVSSGMTSQPIASITCGANAPAVPLPQATTTFSLRFSRLRSVRSAM